MKYARNVQPKFFYVSDSEAIRLRNRNSSIEIPSGWYLETTEGKFEFLLYNYNIAQKKGLHFYADIKVDEQPADSVYLKRGHNSKRSRGYIHFENTAEGGFKQYLQNFAFHGKSQRNVIEHANTGLIVFAFEFWEAGTIQLCTSQFIRREGFSRSQTITKSSAYSQERHKKQL